MADLRLKQLSYSSLLSLHSCPRKYELYKLGADKDEIDWEANTIQNITFSTGHAIGDGVAGVFLGKSEEQIIWEMFLAWDSDLLIPDVKRSKSFWLSVIAMQKLAEMRKNGFLNDWEVVEYEGKPAVELSFLINFPDGFVYRGFVDAVVRNKLDGRVMVLECKTSSAYELSPAYYKNSAQAIGYSIVLDHIFPGLSTYDVQYLIYRTKHMVYEPMKFSKSLSMRARWLSEVMLDIEMIKMYAENSLFPMHGESCKSYGRDCEYFNVCNLSNNVLTKSIDSDVESKIMKERETFQINVSIADLIQTQLEKDNES